MDAVTETDRVARHIERAERKAAQRDLSALSPLQRIIRELMLRALGAYRAEGRFPTNRDFATQTPYFVDASGTRCAMAHLLELGGEQELVARIAGERNNAYVRELADEPRLLAWLEAAGFTVEEAAAIQPSYCSMVTDCICGGDFSHIEYPIPAVGALEGVVMANGMARVERTYGDALGYSAGSEVMLDVQLPEGTRIVAPIDSASAASLSAIRLNAEGTYACSSQGVSAAPPLTAAQFAQAVLADNCPAALRELDAAWSKQTDCDGGNLETGPLDGCNASGGDAMSVGILLALVTVLVRRAR